MHFCSQAFLGFFACVFFVYWLIPWSRARVYVLLASSFYFYACWNQWLAVVIAISTSFDFLVARGIEGARNPICRRALLTLSVSANLGLLCYFKYANFFLRSLEDALLASGMESSLPVLKVLLPIGISFYTFEAINYCVDVYRGQVRAERNLANFMLFVLFFPHLVAGPIVRSRDFLPQIQRPKRWNWARMQVGVESILMGLVKKLVIADRMAQFADPVFAAPEAFKTHALWLAMIAYALQIYGDFSGYSDMAIGFAHLLGYRLAENFNRPYLAENISEFWRRWHMSLSTWLRDYLFIPLGGSRGSAWLTGRNLMLTMTLGGLWHGAAWTFVAWGVLHGALLVGHRTFQSFCRTRPRLELALASSPGLLLRMTTTFLCVSIGWVFFRSASFSAAATFLARLVWPVEGLGCPLHASGAVYTVLLVAVCHLLGRNDAWRRIFARLPAPAVGLAYSVAMSLTLLFKTDSSNDFIYFQF